MATPFDLVQQGEELCREDRIGDAERVFKRAIRAYKTARDRDGMAYALGRLANCYEVHDEVDKAVAAYRQAVDLKAEFPAVYEGFATLLASLGETDEAFRVVDLWQEYGQQHLDGPVHQFLVQLGARWAREKLYDEAIGLLRHAVESISRADFPDEHWQAKGQLGYAYERAGDMDAATGVFVSAIEEGSTDRQTYTRYIMFLERTKQYDEALRVVDQGLRIQQDAAWEVDLRKRKQRIERKAGKLPKDTVQRTIPAFSVRHGQETLTLLHQVRFSPQVGALAVNQETAYATTGGKAPKLTACRLADASTVWQIELPEVASGVVATSESIVTCAGTGAVGAGSTMLRFFDLCGSEVGSMSLPDVPSEVVATGSTVYAGCRDGKLYAFSSQGKLLWSYAVPGSKEPPESAYMRPCPYYVCAGAELVAFSSFSNVFALSDTGRLLWQWSVPEKRSTSRSGNVTFTFSAGPALVRGLAVAAEESRVIATAGDATYELDNGKVRRTAGYKDKALGRVASSRSSGLFATCADEQVLILREGKVSGRFGAPPGAELALNAKADRVAAWGDRSLAVASLAGKRIAEIEFAKRISQAKCLDDGRIVLAAGHLVILGTSGSAAAVSERANKGQPKTELGGGGKALSQMGDRPTSEQGIPVRWIAAEKTTTVGKALYRGRMDQQLTIEQLVLEHYTQLGFTGAWTENEYWWAIMSLLFWDVIFARLPGVFTPQFGDFPSRTQDMPKDLFSPDFHPRRAKMIQKRTQELTQPRWFGLLVPNIESELRSSFRRHRGKPCRLLDWSRYPDVEPLVMAARVLDADQLMAILHRLLNDVNRNRSGLPDLFLAKASDPLFVEVKSEKERVADHQLKWLFYLRDEVGIPVELCRVVDVS